LVSAHYDGGIRLWSLRTGELIHELKNAHDDVISCVRFTPNENCFVSTSRDNTVRAFDIRTYKELFKFEHENYRCSSNTNRLCISSNSKYGFVGSKNGNIVIFDAISGELEEIYEDIHTSAVVACEWQPRGDKFASIDSLGGLYLWQV